MKLHLKKPLLLPCLLFIFLVFACQANAAVSLKLNKYSGNIYLQKDHGNDLWYVFPKNGKRYIFRYNNLENLLRSKAVGMTDENLKKIPLPGEKIKDTNFSEKFRGYILLQVESRGEAWYVNPKDGFRYYLQNKELILENLKKFGTEISNSELIKIPLNQEQIISDFTFNNVAYAKLGSKTFSASRYGEVILPLASLTKLMTALVALDLKPRWDKEVRITKEDIVYPKLFVGANDVTSEIDFKEGDIVKVEDLWNAMLVSSSNQASAALAKNLGITIEEFIGKMNAKAKEMGLKKTRFTDPSGLDIYNVGTAKEMAKITNLAFQIPKIFSVTSKSFTIAAQTANGTKTIKVINRNQSILQFGAEAAKSGFLYEAQRNVAIKKGNSFSVILHARNLTEKNNLIKKLLK